MTPADEIARVARKLPSGAAKACLAMTGEWQFPGKATFNANGAWSLHWTRGVGGKGALCEYELRRDGKRKRAAYRLTPRGLSIRAFLEQERRDG